MVDLKWLRMTATMTAIMTDRSSSKVEQRSSLMYFSSTENPSQGQQDQSSDETISTVESADPVRHFDSKIGVQALQGDLKNLALPRHFQRTSVRVQQTLNNRSWMLRTVLEF